jgi:type IV pilus assembly protein PilV
MSAQLDRTITESNKHAGFTMLEVLVTLVVIAVALLGTAGLQAYSLKTNQSGQLRTQAIVLGMDLMERIEANNVAAVAGAYIADPLPTTATVDCSNNVCSPADLATYDLVQFKTKMEAALPSATATVARAGAGPWTYTVQINWEERITRSTRATTATTGTTTVSASGEIERFSFTSSRTIYDRNLIL